MPADITRLNVGDNVRLACSEGMHAADAVVAALPQTSNTTWPDGLNPVKLKAGTIVGVYHITLLSGPDAEAASVRIKQAGDRGVHNWFKSYSLKDMMTEKKVDNVPVGEKGMLVDIKHVYAWQQVSSGVMPDKGGACSRKMPYVNELQPPSWNQHVCLLGKYEQSMTSHMLLNLCFHK